MKITFLGTRGNIDAKTKRHKRHTVTVIAHQGKRIAIDWGLDWLGLIEKGDVGAPDAIILTHAHPDHVDGLKHGVLCPVYATRGIWKDLKNFPIKEKRILNLRKSGTIFGIKFEAFSLVHSLHVSTVGYRITAGKATIFCAHDLVAIKQPKAALKNIDLYIGDGASIARPIIRKKNGEPFGHASIKMQLDWLQKYKVQQAIFTHCGSQIVEGDEIMLDKKIKAMADERGIGAPKSQAGLKKLHTFIAYDGLTLAL